jgi:hypothetical protein
VTSYGDEHDGRTDGTGSSWGGPHPQRRAWPVAPSHTPPGLPTPAREPDSSADAGTGALDAPTDALTQLTAADLGTAAPAPAPGRAADPPPATPDRATPDHATPDQAPQDLATPGQPTAVNPTPVTAPPVTAPPVTAPPVTAPPATAAPMTVPPLTAPPVTAAPVTAPPFPSGPTSPAPYLASAPPAPGPAPASAPPLAPLAPLTPVRRGRAGWLALAAVTVVLLVGVFAIVKVAGPGGDGARPAAGGSAAPAGAATTVATATASGGTAGEQAAAGASGSPSAVPGGRAASPTAVSTTRPAGKPATAAIGDDFTSGLNGGMWDVYGTSTSSTYNSTMVRVSGGELQILGVGNSPTASANKSGGLCWCGTNGNHVYGKWQVRARFDAGSGYRQVIELWPQSDSDTTDGSINFAGDSDAAKHNLDMSVLQPGGGRDWSGNLSGDFTAWHTYTVEWRAGSVKMWIDSRQVYNSATSKTPLTVPSKPMHLVLQQDKGPAEGIPAANSSTPAQVIMHIDWVRYYS